jgi:hypothetical protein
MPDGIDPARSTGEHSGIWQVARAADDSESSIRKSLFAFARLGVAAFPGFFQRDRNGLLDRFLFRRGMAAAYRSFFFPLIHQRLDITADDCLA